MLVNHIIISIQQQRLVCDFHAKTHWFRDQYIPMLGWSKFFIILTSLKSCNMYSSKCIITPIKRKVTVIIKDWPQQYANSLIFLYEKQITTFYLKKIILYFTLSMRTFLLYTRKGYSIYVIFKFNNKDYAFSYLVQTRWVQLCLVNNFDCNL